MSGALDFGPAAADNDPALLDYFHETKQVKNLLATRGGPTPFLLISRPGGGKSALQKWLCRPEAVGLRLPVTPTHTRVTLRDKAMGAEDFKQLFRFQLALAVVTEAQRVAEEQLDEATGDIRRDLENVASQCREFMRGESVRQIRQGMDERVTGFSLLGFGFTLKPEERSEFLQQIREARLADLAVARVRSLAEHVEITLVVDNPEQIVVHGLDDTSRENAIVLGALLWTLHELHLNGPRVVAFIKEHILDAVSDNYDDCTHFREDIGRLAWTEDDLLALMKERLRIRMNRSWRKAIELSEEEFSAKVFPLLVNGPRDLINLCTRAGEGGVITKESLTQAAPTIAQDAFKNMRLQFGKQWTDVDRICAEIARAIAKKHRSKKVKRLVLEEFVRDSFSDPESELGKLRAQHPLADAFISRPNLADRLHTLGCVGFEWEGRHYFPWHGRPNSEFQRAAKVFLSPVFASS